jgi:phytoene synthase
MPKRRSPHTPHPAAAADPAHAADLAACRARLVHGSRTFLAASWLLPTAVRDPACALYAFCRQADDEVDGQCDGHAPARPLPGGAARGGPAAVLALQQRLQALYDGRPAAMPADRALARVVRQFDIPQALPAALLDGFAWDAEGRRCDTLADLHAYAARVAGSVGAMMALLMGARDPRALARACDLGVAMQLSNIARDVGEDAAQGRLYLPRAWLAEAGLDAERWLARPSAGAALSSVVARVLAEADRLYAQVGAGVAVLPRGCRPGINAARFLYADIGREVARRGLDPLAGRARPAAWRRLAGLGQAVVALQPGTRALARPPLPATLPLVEAVTGPLPSDTWRNTETSRPGLEAVITLFDRLERRDRGWPIPGT